MSHTNQIWLGLGFSRFRNIIRQHLMSLLFFLSNCYPSGELPSLSVDSWRSSSLQGRLLRLPRRRRSSVSVLTSLDSNPTQFNRKVMATLTASTAGIVAQLPAVKNGRNSFYRSLPAGLSSKALTFGSPRRISMDSQTSYPTFKCSISRSDPVGLCSEPGAFRGRRQGTLNSRTKTPNLVCLSALNARCSTEGQTATITRESSTITIAPGKSELSPKIDDGGSGFPPRDDGDGGGGGGGGGGHWSGGFFFFGFLAFLGLLKDREQEDPYGDD